MSELTTIIAAVIADALNDQLDDGLDIFGEGVDYDTLTIDLGEAPGTIIIDGVGAGQATYTVEVKKL